MGRNKGAGIVYGVRVRKGHSLSAADVCYVLVSSSSSCRPLPVARGVGSSFPNDSIFSLMYTGYDRMSMFFQDYAKSTVILAGTQ